LSSVKQPISASIVLKDHVFLSSSLYNCKLLKSTNFLRFFLQSAPNHEQMA
jgi:hypothetical protein